MRGVALEPARIPYEASYASDERREGTKRAASASYRMAAAQCSPRLGQLVAPVRLRFSRKCFVAQFEQRALDIAGRGIERQVVGGNAGGAGHAGSCMGRIERIS